MRSRFWQCFLSYLSSGTRGRARRAVTFRPRLESLEQLVLPSGVTFLPTHVRSVHPLASHLGTPAGLNPTQVRHAYGFDQITFQGGTLAGTGAGQTIAIVDAYDDPSIAADLTAFDQQFGLPTPPSFVKVGISAGGAASTTRFPRADAGWAGEIELDVEWAHAVAPGASILLVEANSASVTDLLNAVDYARTQPGVVAVSMSWGSGEFSGEQSYDSHFTTPAGHAGVTFFGSSGDNGSPSLWPALSTHVVGVGGTHLNVDASGNYLGETGWGGSGGGLSSFISQPGYQAGLTIHNGSGTLASGGKRAGPDVAYDADPNSGVAVYGTYGWGGWAVVSGTSAAAPQWAALMAIADQGRALAGRGALDGFTQALPALYGLSAADFRDVTGGSNGGYKAGPGYDLVTGRGSPVANLVVRDLVGGATTPPGGTSKPPTVATAAHVVSRTATTASLAVLGADAAGEASLTYTWKVVGTAPAPVTFSANGSNAAKNTTVTFGAAGTYTFQVTITDPAGLTVTSQVTVAGSTVSFSDNFTAGAGNWTVTSGFGNYYLANVNGNNRLMVYDNGTGVSRAVAGQSSWADYSYQATLNIDAISAGSASLLARVQDNMHLYFFGYNVALGKWMIAVRNGPTVAILATGAPFALVPDQDYTVRADLNGSALKLYVGGVLQVSTTDTTYASGKIGFTATSALALLDDVVVTVTGSTSTASHSLASSITLLLSQENQRHRLGGL